MVIASLFVPLCYDEYLQEQVEDVVIASLFVPLCYDDEKTPRLAIQAAKDCLTGEKDIKKLKALSEITANLGFEKFNICKNLRAGWAALAACSAANAAYFYLEPHIGYVCSRETAKCARSAAANARESRRTLGKAMADFAGEADNKGHADRDAEMEFQVNLFKGIFGKTNHAN